MSSNELQQLAKKYLKGAATDSEKERLNQWYNEIYNDEATETVTLDSSETEDQIKYRILARINREIKLNVIEGRNAVSRTGTIKRMWLSIASAAAVIFIAGSVWYYNQSRQILQESAGIVEITTNKVTKITLPDGSLVWLNAHTTFKYPHSFAGKIRQVQLTEGRAFFDVRHQLAHPFLVKTPTLNITVLGTSFDVRTNTKEGTTKVNVITGRVGITRPDHAGEAAIMLLPKQQVVLNKASSQLTKEISHDAVVNLWCKSPLVFDQENLDNVFKAIEKQYNTHIEVTDKRLLNEHISITLGNQRLDTIMEILSFTKHFNYQIANDSTVVIR